MRRLIKTLVAFTLLFGRTVPLAFGYTKDDTAKTAQCDGTSSDLQAAINYADARNEDGWVFTSGSAGGTYVWTSGVLVPDTYTNSLTIQSAGGAANRTTITCNFDTSSSVIGIRGADNKTQKIYGFRFNMSGSHTIGDGFVCIYPTGTATARNAFWVDGCRWEDVPGALHVLIPNWTGGAIYGLISNFELATTSGKAGFYFYSGNNGNNWTSGGVTNGSMTWGTADTIVVEDGTWTNTGSTVPGLPAIDSSYNGVRWMARHFTAYNWVFVAHGADSAPTSTLQVELLHGRVEVTDAVDYMMYLRGGTMRFTDMTVVLNGGSAWLNQIIKTANDSAQLDNGNALYPDRFQQIGHGVSGGTEVILPIHVWSNTLPGGVTVVNAPNNNADRFTKGVHWNDTNPGDYSELAYPHPMRGVTPATPRAATSSRYPRGNTIRH